MASSDALVARGRLCRLKAALLAAAPRELVRAARRRPNSPAGTPAVPGARRLRRRNLGGAGVLGCSHAPVSRGRLCGLKAALLAAAPRESELAARRRPNSQAGTSAVPGARRSRRRNVADAGVLDGSDAPVSRGRLCGLKAALLARRCAHSPAQITPATRRRRTLRWRPRLRGAAGRWRKIPRWFSRRRFRGRAGIPANPR